MANFYNIFFQYIFALTMLSQKEAGKTRHD
jgi:hypothetical protein